jgi:hypothetical protein
VADRLRGPRPYGSAGWNFVYAGFNPPRRRRKSAELVEGRSPHLRQKRLVAVMIDSGILVPAVWNRRGEAARLLLRRHRIAAGIETDRRRKEEPVAALVAAGQQRGERQDGNESTGCAHGILSSLDGATLPHFSTLEQMPCEPEVRMAVPATCGLVWKAARRRATTCLQGGVPR